MDFLRKHYEKIILSLVLVGLAYVAIRLPIALSDAKAELENPTGPVPKPKPTPPFDMSNEEQALIELTNAPRCVMSGENNVLNPVVWKLNPDGSLIRITKEGPAALKIVRITPLNLEIDYDSAPAGGSGYYLSVARNGGKKQKEYLALNATSKSGLFKLTAIKGPPENPSELELELLDIKTSVSISTNKPYTRIESYAADLKYPAAEPMPKKKVGEVIKLDGESYKIIVIKSDFIILENKSAQQFKIDLNEPSSP